MNIKIVIKTTGEIEITLPVPGGSNGASGAGPAGTGDQMPSVQAEVINQPRSQRAIGVKPSKPPTGKAGTQRTRSDRHPMTIGERWLAILPPPLVGPLRELAVGSGRSGFTIVETMEHLERLGQKRDRSSIGGWLGRLAEAKLLIKSSTSGKGGPFMFRLPDAELTELDRSVSIDQSRSQPAEGDH